MAEHILRDVRCSDDVGQMAELGKFDKEFTVYGYACRVDGTTYYRISQHENVVSKLCDKRRIQGYFPTLITSHTQRTGVPSGMEADIWQEEQWNLGFQLETQYRDEFLEQLNQLGNHPAKNGAYDMLIQWKNSLEGRFQREQQIIFDMMTDTAFLSKQLTPSAYDELMQWSAYNWKQMEDDIIIKDIYERTLHGILYETPEGIKDVYDAQYEVIYRKRQQLMLEGVLVSPVYSKTCWFRSFGDFSGIKKQYEETLYTLMMPAINFMREIKKMESFLPEEEFLSVYKAIQANDTKQELETLTFYGHLWSCV